jgi:hypothetical protein
MEGDSTCGGATVCCRKIDGKWLIKHEHNSVPFDGKSGRALLDLKPWASRIRMTPFSSLIA